MTRVSPSLPRPERPAKVVRSLSPEHLAFVKAVRRYRVASGMTQTKLADLLNVSREVIADVERGRFCPTLDNAARIAAAMGVSLSKLVSVRKQPEKNSRSA